eukprot:GEMP01111518.1.p1 GENE.GEMP01111518.1~~GEMP01111518.1.p1  ORF type:complete len:118 (+),score=24.39 GEMP01111518.1:137-490(+)
MTHFVLACIFHPDEDTEKVMFLSPNLTLVAVEDDAAVWAFELEKPFRKMAGDVCVRIFSPDTQQYLCSAESKKAVLLLNESEANAISPQTKEYIFNIAWELTPDEDDPAHVAYFTHC